MSKASREGRTIKNPRSQDQASRNAASTSSLIVGAGDGAVRALKEEPNCSSPDRRAHEMMVAIRATLGFSGCLGMTSTGRI